MQLQEAIEMLDDYNDISEKSYRQMRDSYNRSLDELVSMFRKRNTNSADLDALVKFIIKNGITWPEIEK